jgi:hypothetical protein
LDTSLAIVGPLDEKGNGEWKDDRGKHGDKPLMSKKRKRRCRNKRQETKPTPGYAPSPEKTTKSRI